MTPTIEHVDATLYAIAGEEITWHTKAVLSDGRAVRLFVTDPAQLIGLTLYQADRYRNGYIHTHSANVTA